MSESDEALMAAVADGDRDAFAALFRRRRPDVYRFALHMTGSPAAADDIAQEVFLAVIADPGRFVAGRAGVVPWLLGIARNHVRRRRGERRYDEIPCGAREPVSTADPSADLIQLREAERLQAALTHLPEHYRTAVVLCDLQELSYDEAAAASGCAVGTVRSRLHRGRTLLAERMREGRRAWPGWPAAEWL